MDDVVLIHSTGQSAAGWDRVAQALRERGASPYAIDLPSSPTMRAADYSELLARTFGGLDSPVVVAHSGSGALLPGVAAALDARLQVWLAAWVPDRELSFMDEVRAYKDVAFDPGWIGKDPIADADVARHFLYHDCDDETLEWALSTRRVFYPASVYDEVIPLHDTVRSVYVLATEDRTILPAWQRKMARERLGVEPVEIESGHCPNVSKPGRLADILVGSLA